MEAIGVAAKPTDATLAASMASLKLSTERLKEIAGRSMSTDATLARMARASWKPREEVVQVTTMATPLSVAPTVARLNLSLGREPTSTMGAHKVFDGMSERQEETSSHVLHATISCVLYPLTEEVIHQVFDPYGVNEICVMQESTHVKAFVEFQSWREASKARGGLHGRCIYDGCCFMDIQHAPPSISIHRLPNSEPVVVDWDRVEVEPLNSSPPSVATPTPTSTTMPISGDRVVQVREGAGHVAAMAANTDEACPHMLPTEPQTDYEPQDTCEQASLGDATQIVQLISDDSQELLTHVGGVSLFLEQVVNSTEESEGICSMKRSYDECIADHVLSYVGGMSLFLEEGLGSSDEMFQAVFACPENTFSFSMVDVPAEDTSLKAGYEESPGDVITHVGGLSLFLEFDLQYDKEMFGERRSKDTVSDMELSDTVLTHVGEWSLFIEHGMVTCHEFQDRLYSDNPFDHGVDLTKLLLSTGCTLVLTRQVANFFHIEQLLASRLHSSWDPGGSTVASLALNSTSFAGHTTGYSENDLLMDSMRNSQLFDFCAIGSGLCQSVLLFAYVIDGICFTFSWDLGEHIYVDSSQLYTIAYELLATEGHAGKVLWFSSNETLVHPYVVASGGCTRPWDPGKLQQLLFSVLGPRKCQYEHALNRHIMQQLCGMAKPWDPGISTAQVNLIHTGMFEVKGDSLVFSRVSPWDKSALSLLLGNNTTADITKLSLVCLSTQYIQDALMFLLLATVKRKKDWAVQGKRSLKFTEIIQSEQAGYRPWHPSCMHNYFVQFLASASCTCSFSRRSNFCSRHQGDTARAVLRRDAFKRIASEGAEYSIKLGTRYQNFGIQTFFSVAATSANKVQYMPWDPGGWHHRVVMACQEVSLGDTEQMTYKCRQFALSAVLNAMFSTSRRSRCSWKRHSCHCLGTSNVFWGRYCHTRYLGQGGPGLNGPAVPVSANKRSSHARRKDIEEQNRSLNSLLCPVRLLQSRLSQVRRLPQATSIRPCTELTPRSPFAGNG